MVGTAFVCLSSVPRCSNTRHDELWSLRIRKLGETRCPEPWILAKTGSLIHIQTGKRELRVRSESERAVGTARPLDSTTWLTDRDVSTPDRNGPPGYF